MTQKCILWNGVDFYPRGSVFFGLALEAMKNLPVLSLLVHPFSSISHILGLVRSKIMQTRINITVIRSYLNRVMCHFVMHCILCPGHPYIWSLP